MFASNEDVFMLPPKHLKDAIYGNQKFIGNPMPIAEVDVQDLLNMGWILYQNQDHEITAEGPEMESEE